MYRNIPNELKNIQNWVCWKAYPDANAHSGIKKVPINPVTGGQAMSNNPQTWSSFETAVRVASAYDGIGFMFSNSGFFGIDLDDCREDINAYLKGDKANIVAEFIGQMQTYAETSQSGNGIHLICSGSLPQGGRRKGKVEMYDSGRFFIMTGNAIGGYTAISNGTERIKPLHQKYFGAVQQRVSAPAPTRATPTLSDHELIEKILNSANGDKFAALYGGDFSDYPSQSEADMTFCSILAFWCSGDAETMDRIYRSSNLMREKWDRKQCGSTYGAMTISRAVENCQSFYQPQEQDDYYITIKNPTPAPAVVTSMHGTTSPSGSILPQAQPTAKLPMHTLDDTGNAERMNDYCGRVFRYNYTDKRWMYYKDGVWVYDDRGAIFAAADVILDRMKIELKSWTEHEGGAYLQDYQKHMKKTRSNASKTAMVKEFQHIVPISPAELDTHKTLVNTQNGVVDLDTCTTVPHSPELLMTRMLGTSMPANPKKPVLWLRFLDDIFGDDKELIRYIQKSLGYCLSGSTAEQCVFFLYGNGRNGKSTFLEIIRAILGEYATNIQPESIMVKNSSNSANTDIARLKGARLVTSVEPNEGMRLNEGLIKQLTGDDMVTARKLYGDEFEYRPEFKLWLATNHKPTIRGTDLGIWRRIHIIPFTHSIPEDKVDKNLGEKLREEMPDILAWMMEGYRLWKYEGLHKPKAVEDSVKEYRNEMDVIAAFLDSDYCMDGGEAKSSSLYAVYCRWASESNEYKMSSRKFGIEMGKRYKKKKDSKGNIAYVGLSLTTISISNG